MHIGNHEWLEALKERFPFAFKNARVLELGSADLNGSARDHFRDAASYVGVDRVKWKGVDVVCEAKATSFRAGEFDTLVCVSMLEHDPGWRESVRHNLQWVKPGGYVMLSFGSDGNLRHDPEPWRPIPPSEFMNEAAKWPLHILESYFEADRFTGDCLGVYDVVALKKKEG